MTTRLWSRSPENPRKTHQLWRDPCRRIVTSDTARAGMPTPR